MTKPKYWKQAKIFLSKKDKVLKKLILKYKGSLKTRKDPFFSLCKSIVGQQISVQAANSVWRKLEKKAKKIVPKNISKLNNRQLSSCGLSRQKISYLKSLAGSELDFHELEEMENEEVINVLTNIKGIGLWTAEIYCIFSLRRIDIFPAGDLALQEATRQLLVMESRPSEKEMREIAKSWMPYRSVCAIILWHLYRNFKSRESTLW